MGQKRQEVQLAGVEDADAQNSEGQQHFTKTSDIIYSGGSSRRFSFGNSRKFWADGPPVDIVIETFWTQLNAIFQYLRMRC